MGSQTVITVPVKVHSGSGCFDVFSVVYIEAAVIVLGVVDAVFSCTAIETVKRQKVTTEQLLGTDRVLARS